MASNEVASAELEARYQGRCVVCDCWFPVGEKIRMTDDGAIHTGCLGAALPAPAEREMCSICFTVKANNGRCNCG